jgi:phage baseplate assembly protein W
MAAYRGFSFKNWQNNKDFVMTDVELVKQDLLNHIFTRRGERVGQRGFGTVIQDLLFEPFDDNTVTTAADQIRAVIEFDPRVQLQAKSDFVVRADYDTSILYIAARLYFVELDLVDILHINLRFES